MPFTLAHSAAALPFRRSRLVPSALVIGTLAPDFEYFLRFAPDDGFGHTFRGTMILTLPVALLVLWLFHSFAKLPAIRLLPDPIQRRLSSSTLVAFRFGGPVTFLMIIISILVGVASHVLWDSFTHPGTWVYHHWSLLQQTVLLPVAGPTPVYKVFQHGSTIVGIGILLGWFANWYLGTPATGDAGGISPHRKVAIGAVVTAVALIGGITRAFVGVGSQPGQLAYKKFAGELIVTMIALVWWQLVAYGMLLRSGSGAEEELRVQTLSSQSTTSDVETQK